MKNKLMTISKSLICMLFIACISVIQWPIMLLAANSNATPIPKMITQSELMNAKVTRKIIVPVETVLETDDGPIQGMKKVTIDFIRKVSSEGAEYIADVDISGLYKELALETI